jgi:hypothetical protein
MKRMLSLIVAVALSWFIFQYFTTKSHVKQVSEPTMVTEVIEGIKSTFSAEEMPSVPLSKESTEVSLPTTDIKLEDLNLKPEHEALLKKVGIDTKTFVITKDMVACAEKKVGSVRINEFIQGTTPTLTEMSTLISCFK